MARWKDLIGMSSRRGVSMPVSTLWGAVPALRCTAMIGSCTDDWGLRHSIDR